MSGRRSNNRIIGLSDVLDLKWARRGMIKL